jgi:hypothetical protein
MHVENSERSENRQSDDLLQNFELGESQCFVTEPVGRDLKEIFKERYAPAQERGDVPLFVIPISQVGVPRESHERVGADEKERRAEKNGRFHMANIIALASLGESPIANRRSDTELGKETKAQVDDGGATFSVFYGNGVCLPANRENRLTVSELMTPV